MCRHMPPAPGCQAGPVPCLRRPESSCPGLAAVGGAEERGVFDAGVDGVGIGERGLEVPDALELPRVRRAVVPLVGAGDRRRRRTCCRRGPRWRRHRRSAA